MVQYATAVELAGYMQQDVDTYTANLILTTASQMFSTLADTMFASTSVTYSVAGDGRRSLRLPYIPIVAVSALRVAGVTVAGSEYTLIRDVLYRKTGTFGTPCRFPPDLVEVDLTHGYASVPDDVKSAVLETAAAAYSVPVSAVIGESIDDYQVRYSAAGGGVQLTPSTSRLAQAYRGTFAA